MAGSDLWDGLDTAPTFERGQWFKSGFKGLVSINRCLYKESQNSGDGLIVEMKIHSTNMPTEHPTDSEGTWWQALKSTAIAWPAIKAFIYAVLAADQKNAADQARMAMIDQAIKGIMLLATGERNVLAGYPVQLETVGTLTRAKEPFTRYDFSPYNWAAAGKPVPDLAPLLQAAAQAQQEAEQAKARNRGGWGGARGGPSNAWGSPNAGAPPPPPQNHFGGAAGNGAWGAPPPPYPPPAVSPFVKGKELSPDGKWELINGAWALYQAPPPPPAPPAYAPPPALPSAFAPSFQAPPAPPAAPVNTAHLSADGKLMWNGTAWVPNPNAPPAPPAAPVNPAHISPDGMLMWNGSAWVPNDNIPF